MSIKSVFGLDGVELGIHVLVTAIVLSFSVTFNRRMAELEAGQTRMAELEERLDFAERLLAQPPAERRVLAPGEPQ